MSRCICWPSIALCLALASSAAGVTTSDLGHGCEANPTGNPIGGGEGYEPIFTSGDFTVTSKREFLDALQQAQPGQVIFFPDGVEIDLTGTDRIQLPGSVTLAGTRGRDGSAGGGQPGTSYEAAWNLFSGKTNGHTVDMHGGRDIGDGTDTAGDYVHIHHNSFTPGNYFPEIVIRGTPAQGCKIHNNWFEREPDRAIWLFGGNSLAWDSIYEPDRKPQKAGIQGPNRTIDVEGRGVPIAQQRN